MESVIGNCQSGQEYSNNSNFERYQTKSKINKNQKKRMRGEAYENVSKMSSSQIFPRCLGSPRQDLKMLIPIDCQNLYDTYKL